MNTKKTYDIVGGPNKDLLYDACKYAYDKSVKINISFTTVTGYTMPEEHPGCAYISLPISDIKICGIEHEDGSGESLNLYGYCRTDLNYLKEAEAGYKPYKFKAYYNSKTRKGWISFLD